MNKTLWYRYIVLLAVALLWSEQVGSANPLAGLSEKDWAYQAANDLQEAGLLARLYPAGHFNGQSTLTPADFAVATRQALEVCGILQPEPQQAAQYRAYWQEKRGKPSPPELSLILVRELIFLTREFRFDLTDRFEDGEKALQQLKLLHGKKRDALKDNPVSVLSFKTTPEASQAIKDLQTAGLLIGPFEREKDSKGALTQEELLSAFAYMFRFLKNRPDVWGDLGDHDIPHNPDVNHGQIQAMLVLLNAFKNELAAQGWNVKQINLRLTYLDDSIKH
ncbi:MAG TPA: hypothetical protein VKU00_12090 [Chthonomonadaceae bacterium]|nr:hypothetical protein [Chthonomonadaceae bacterium]